MKTKQIGVLAMTILISFLFYPNTAIHTHAVSLQEPEDHIVVPYWTNINQTITQISIVPSGMIEVSGVLTGYPGITTEIRIFLYLEKHTNGKWITINSWHDSFYSYRGALINSTALTRGYLYRVKASYYAYRGNNYEHITQYSNSIYY